VPVQPHLVTAAAAAAEVLVVLVRPVRRRRLIVMMTRHYFIRVLRRAATFPDVVAQPVRRHARRHDVAQSSSLIGRAVRP